MYLENNECALVYSESYISASIYYDGGAGIISNMIIYTSAMW